MSADFGDASGVVESYDDDRGDGHVRTDDGRLIWFHCTAIADGSRRIEPGTRVSLVVQAGLPGQWEAARLTPS